jgi:hypothetical protein
MSIFQSIIALAFDSAPIGIDVSSGPFSVRLHLDEWANEQKVAASLPERRPGASAPPDLTLALLGGTPLPQDFLPSDMSRCAIYEDEHYLTIWMPLPEGVLYVWDFDNNRGVMWCTTPAIAPWVLGRPFLALVNAYTSRTDWCPLHAAAVGRNGRFLLMIGPGRAGKSTAALSCAAAGWQYAGDDFVLINPKLRRVEPLYTSGRLRKSAPAELAGPLSRFVFTETNEFNDPKFELRFRASNNEALIQGGVIEHILIPRRRGGNGFATERAKSGETFSAMMTHTRLCSLGRIEQLTKKLFSATRMHPAYFVDTGNDVAAIPAGLQQILDGRP